MYRRRFRVAASTLNEWQFCPLVGGFDFYVYNSTSRQVSDHSFIYHNHHDKLITNNDGNNYNACLFCFCRLFCCLSIPVFLSSHRQFLRATAGTAIARLSHRNSVCPSVCLSVRPSHGWIRQKRRKLGSSNLHHRLPQRL